MSLRALNMSCILEVKELLTILNDTVGVIGGLGSECVSKTHVYVMAGLQVRWMGGIEIRGFLDPGHPDDKLLDQGYP